MHNINDMSLVAGLYSTLPDTTNSIWFDFAGGAINTMKKGNTDTHIIILQCPNDKCSKDNFAVSLTTDCDSTDLSLNPDKFNAVMKDGVWYETFQITVGANANSGDICHVTFLPSADYRL